VQIKGDKTMSLIKREPSPAQSIASRANSLRSTEPSTERGKAISSRNLPRPRPHSEVVAHSIEALGERPGDFERTHKALIAAMEPRDGWEDAWVQDIAILRSRVERLQRAEVGVLAMRKQKHAGDRQRENMPPSGFADLGQSQQIRALGLTGLRDSPWKFQQVLEMLHNLRDLVIAGMFEADGVVYFNLLYGENPGMQGAMLRGPFQVLSKRQAEGEVPYGDPGQVALTASVNREIEHYQQRQALYMAEHKDNDPVRDDADLLLPSQEMGDVIRYETHLEDQIERKLRQFYARRREPVLRQMEPLPASIEEPVAAELACQTAPEGLLD
jgi:hypothetical protein